MKLNQDTKNPTDMPKLQSPFERQEINGEYICIPKIEKGYEWVFSGQSIAIEKLDGSNISIIVENNQVTAIYNRKNRIDIWKKGNKRFTEGVLEAIDTEYINLAKMKDGQYFGELIGPQVNANPYQLKRHLWIPLSILVERCRFKFWDEFVKELEDGNKNRQYCFLAFENRPCPGFY